MKKIFFFSLIPVVFFYNHNSYLAPQKAITSYTNTVAKDVVSFARTVPPYRVNLNNYSLVLMEDFQGNSLNSKRWNYLEENTVRGFGKMLRSNVVVSNGTLKLYAKRETGAAGHESFSGAMISTEHSLNQRYGYFETKAKLNKQIGPNIAFWLLQHSVGMAKNPPNPAIYGTEIDAFEYHRAAGADSLYYNLHWNGYNFSNGTHRTTGISAYVPSVSDGFHIFGLEWTPKDYIFFVDGVETGRMNIAISHVPEFIIFSTEINGYGGDRFKMSSTTPDVLEVDYLKVYARKPSVTLYGSCDYQGWVLPDLKPGNYNLAMLTKLGMLNDDAASIEIPKGWTVTAYEHDNFAGESITVTSDSRCAGNFDNKLSSLKITNP